MQSTWTHLAAPVEMSEGEMLSQHSEPRECLKEPVKRVPREGMEGKLSSACPHDSARGPIRLGSSVPTFKNTYHNCWILPVI